MSNDIYYTEKTIIDSEMLDAIRNEERLKILTQIKELRKRVGLGFIQFDYLEWVIKNER